MRPKFTTTNTITAGLTRIGRAREFLGAVILIESTFHLADNKPFIWPSIWLANGRNDWAIRIEWR
jgi:hypothetical protein